MDLQHTTIQEQLKRIAAYRGLSQTELGEEFNKRQGTNYNQQSFSRKLKNGVINWGELQTLGAILHFEVEIKLLD